MQHSLSFLAALAGEQLRIKGLNLVTAESCTGGGLSFWLTSVPGCSAWFERGFITYSNDAKVEMLDVDTEILNKFGAVSKETAIAMAEGALGNSHATLSISITGIAGPDGGSPSKPVGTIWLGFAGDFTSYAELVNFSGDRQTIRDETINLALKKLIDLAMMANGK